MTQRARVSSLAERDLFQAAWPSRLARPAWICTLASARGPLKQPPASTEVNGTETRAASWEGYDLTLVDRTGVSAGEQWPSAIATRPALLLATPRGHRSEPAWHATEVEAGYRNKRLVRVRRGRCEEAHPCLSCPSAVGARPVTETVLSPWTVGVVCPFHRCART